MLILPSFDILGDWQSIIWDIVATLQTTIMLKHRWDCWIDLTTNLKAIAHLTYIMRQLMYLIKILSSKIILLEIKHFYCDLCNNLSFNNRLTGN